MRLFLFEFKKIWKNRLCLPVLLVLCIICAVFFMEEPKYASGRRQVISLLREDYAFYDALPEQEKENFRKAMTKAYGEEVFDPFSMPDPASMNSPGYFGEDIPDYNYIYVVRTLAMHQEEFADIQKSVTEAAKILGRKAVREENNYEIRRNLDVIRLYRKVRQPLTGEIRNWDRFLFTPYPMFLILLMAFFVSSGIFTREKDTNAALLLRTAADGKMKTAWAKYAAAAVFTAVCFLLIRGVSLLTVALNFGLMGWSQPVWAIRELAYCPYTLTVGQYVFFAMTCELAAALIVSLLCTSVSAVSKNSVFSFLINALFLGGCVGLYFLSPRAELLKGPLSLMTPLTFFESYYTANVLSFPVPWMLVHVILWGLVCFFCAFFCGRFFFRVRDRL